MAHYHQIDLAEAFAAKMEENKLKYPIEKARDSSEKYSDL